MLNRSLFINNQELEILKKIKTCALEIESVATDGHFPENLLAKLYILLTLLTESESQELQRLSEIQDHLHPQMTLRHFVNFMIPIERLLGKSLREDAFLITKQDQVDKVPEKFPLIFVLDNIRSAFNVGSIFRLADGVGATEVHLCGYTPTPDTKTALGTETCVDFRSWHNLETALQDLAHRGFAIWGLETSRNSTSLFKWQIKGPTALVVGNERFGLEASSLAQMQGVIELPMSGMKNSLNVVAALSAVAFEWKRQWFIHSNEV